MTGYPVQQLDSKLLGTVILTGQHILQGQGKMCPGPRLDDFNKQDFIVFSARHDTVSIFHPYSHKFYFVVLYANLFFEDLGKKKDRTLINRLQEWKLRVLNWLSRTEPSIAIGWSVPILKSSPSFRLEEEWRRGEKKRFSGKQSKSNPTDTMEWNQVLEEISIGWERDQMRQKQRTQKRPFCVMLHLCVCSGILYRVTRTGSVGRKQHSTHATQKHQLSRPPDLKSKPTLSFYCDHQEDLPSVLVLT